MGNDDSTHSGITVYPNKITVKQIVKAQPLKTSCNVMFS